MSCSCPRRSSADSNSSRRAGGAGGRALAKRRHGLRSSRIFRIAGLYASGVCVASVRAVGIVVEIRIAERGLLLVAAARLEAGLAGVVARGRQARKAHGHVALFDITAADARNPI